MQFEATDSASDKALYIYRLLVHDKLITPMPEDQVAEKTIRHRLASWYAHLPKGSPDLTRGLPDSGPREHCGTRPTLIAGGQAFAREAH